MLRALSMDLPNKELKNTTGRNATWGVFKAYAVFFSSFQHWTNSSLLITLCVRPFP